MGMPLARHFSEPEGTTVLGMPLARLLSDPLRTGVPAIPFGMGPDFSAWLIRAMPLPICVLARDILNRKDETKRMLWGSKGNECFRQRGVSPLPTGAGEVTEVGEPGTGISNAHKKPFTDKRTFWLS